MGLTFEGEGDFREKLQQNIGWTAVGVPAEAAFRDEVQNRHSSQNGMIALLLNYSVL